MLPPEPISSPADHRERLRLLREDWQHGVRLAHQHGLGRAAADPFTSQAEWHARGHAMHQVESGHALRKFRPRAHHQAAIPPRLIEKQAAPTAPFAQIPELRVAPVAASERHAPAMPAHQFAASAARAISDMSPASSVPGIATQIATALTMAPTAA